MIYLAAGGLLDVNPGLLIWGPIIHALDERAEKIHGDIEKADKIRKDAEGLLASYNEKLTAARDEAIAIVNEANADATRLKAKTLQETQDEIKSLKEQSLKDIELAKVKAVQEIQTQIVDLSITIAGQILQTKLKPEEHAKYVQDEITKLKSVKV